MSNSQVSSTSSDRKYLTFHLNGYLFALHSQEILKVIATPTPERGGMIEMGLIQLAQYSIQILDLKALLNLSQKDIEPKEANTQEPVRNSSFLMVLQQADQALWGIVVNHPPDLISLADSDLQPVPADRRTASALKGISHVVTCAQRSEATEATKKVSQILLVLDLSTLIAISKASLGKPKTEIAVQHRFPVASNA